MDLRHPDFNVQLNEDPQSGAMCEIGFHFLPPGEKRISTYVGTSGQNSVCIRCLDEAYAVAHPKKRLPADGTLRVEAATVGD